MNEWMNEWTNEQIHFPMVQHCGGTSKSIWLPIFIVSKIQWKSIGTKSVWLPTFFKIGLEWHEVNYFVVYPFKLLKNKNKNICIHFFFKSYKILK